MRAIHLLIGLMQAKRPPMPATPPDSARGSGSEPKWNLIATLLVLLSTALELGIREAFYRVSSEAPSLLLVAVLALLALAMGWRFLRADGDSLTRRAGGRVMMLAAFFVWWRLTGMYRPSGALLWGCLLLLVVGFVTALRLDASRWATLSRVLTVGVVIFVLSQPLLAFLRASDLQWPPPAPAGGGLAGQPVPQTTVVVLLDELSAKAAGPIAEAMARSGYPVVQRAIKPSGDATGKVVPSLFTGREFKESKPCSWHAVCSDSEVLDLDRIKVSRPDIDIVGFYFPYCAIKGLRSCNVVSPMSPYLDMARWHCAAQRRSEWLTRFDGEAERLRCAEQIGRVWATLGEGVESAIWNAPAWTRGGVLYAHVPLPHPPGVGSEGSLELHYRANIAKAAQLIGAMAERLASQKRPFSLVVFSDHPLRPYWCQSMQYRQSCPPSAELLDDRVPLFATGVVDPAFGSIRSNMKIFNLISAERR